MAVLLSDIIIFGKPYQFSDSLSFLGSLNLKDCQIEEQASPSRSVGRRPVGWVGWVWFSCSVQHSVVELFKQMGC